MIIIILSGDDDEEVMQIRAWKIYNKYIKDKAKHPVLLPNELRDQIRMSLDHPAHGMFDEAMEEVFAMMEETIYPEFLKDPIMQKCKAALLRELLSQTSPDSPKKAGGTSDISIKGSRDFSTLPQSPNWGADI